MRQVRLLVAPVLVALVLTVPVSTAMAEGHGRGDDPAPSHDKESTTGSVYTNPQDDHGQGKGEDDRKGHGQSTGDNVYATPCTGGNLQFFTASGQIVSTGTSDGVYGSTSGSVYGSTSGSVYGTSGSVYGSTSGSVYGGTSGSVYGSTSGSVYGDDQGKGCGEIRGQAHHLAAVQKVLDKLQDQLEHLNPTAASNVEAVIGRLQTELKTAGVATSDADAGDKLRQHLQAKSDDNTADKGDLDLLATLQAKAGAQADAVATREKRIADDPTDSDAYTALGQQLTASGPPSEITTFVAGKQPNFDVKPFVRDGRTLVPVRAIVEALGAKVTWDPATQTVTIVRGNITVQLVIGNSTATVNGAPATLDVPPDITGGRTVIPLRFVAEMLGMKVDWLGSYKMIAITPTGIAPGGTGSTGTGSTGTGSTGGTGTGGTGTGGTGTGGTGTGGTGTTP